ncbi:MAG: phage tail tube protein [Oscillospiraceae bacterium]|jgi:hypothetical protein|nr:phage tail tube protein [Oscillospiraceae bacterium]
MSEFLRAGDIISGQEGKITFDINGNIELGGYVKNVEASAEKEKSDIKVLGHRGTQSKTVGWSGSGSMTLYYITPLFRKMMLDYIKTGKDTYFTIIIENEDPASTVGKQTIVLYNCNIDSVVLAKLDVDSTELDEDIDFTFDNADMQDSFSAPTLV